MQVVEKFELPIDTGETDEYGDPIYEYIPHQEETVSIGKQLKRVANKGHVQSCHLKDGAAVDVYQDGNLVATWELIPQYWHISEWRDYTKTVDLFSMVDGHLIAEGEQGGFSWDIDIAWTANDSKWTINAQAPGFLFRFRWNIVFTELGQSLIADGTLQLGVDDYPGETLDDEGTVERNIIFEPDGVEDELIVDPYLSIEEESTYYTVQCDGYIIKVYKGDQSTAIIRVAFDGTDLVNNLLKVSVDATTYAASYDTSRSVTIVENSGARCVFRIKGTMNSSAGSGVQADINFQLSYYYIYIDKIIITTLLDVDTGGCVLDNSQTFNGITYCSNLYSNQTEEYGIAESSGTEVKNATGTLTSAVYCVACCDEFNNQCIQMHQTESSGYVQRIPSVSNINYMWNDVTLAAGTHTMTVAWIFDTAYREEITPETAWATSTSYSVGALVIESTMGYECISAHTSGTFATDLGSDYWIRCNKYTSTDRLLIGSQYQDLYIGSSPDEGSWVTDHVLPESVSTSGFARDGAFHIDVDSNQIAEIALDRTRYDQLYAVHDPNINTGTISSHTEHLIGYWKCNDDAATLTVVAEVGNDGATNGSNTSTLSNSDAVRGTSLLTSGTSDLINLSPTIPTDVDKFTILMRFKPNFIYNISSSQGICNLYGDDNNSIGVIYNSTGDYFQVQVEVDSSIYTINGPAYTENNTLQQWHTIQLAVDLSKDLIYFFLNGEGIGIIKITEEYSTDPTYFYICYIANSTNTAYGSIYVDEILLYDACVLPCGTFLPGQITSGGVSYNDAHTGVLCFIKGDETTNDPLKIGAGNITVVHTGLKTDVYDNAKSAFRINTTSCKVQIGTSGNFNKDEGSISFWMKSVDSSPLTYSAICSDYDNYENFSVYRTGSNFVFNQSNSVSLAWPHTPFDEVWHFIMCKWSVSGSYRELWIDGVLGGRSDISFTTTIGASAAFIIGNTEDMTDYIDSEICDITITNDPNTPQLPCVLGEGPAHIPFLTKLTG